MSHHHGFYRVLSPIRVLLVGGAVVKPHGLLVGGAVDKPHRWHRDFFGYLWCFLCILSSLGLWTPTLDITFFPLDRTERLKMTISASGHE